MGEGVPGRRAWGGAALRRPLQKDRIGYGARALAGRHRAGCEWGPARLVHRRKVRELFFQPEAVVQEEVMEEEAEAAEAAADPGQRLRNRMRNTYLTLHRTALYKRAVIDAGKTWEDERTRNLLWRRLGRDDFNALCVDGPEYLSLMLTTLRAQPKERDPAGKTNKP